jgi:hypothetical protein
MEARCRRGVSMLLETLALALCLSDFLPLILDRLYTIIVYT